MVLVGIWLLFLKQKQAILAIIFGNLILGAVGFLQNPRWLQLFFETALRKSGQTFGLYPTLWSAANIVCQQGGGCIAGLSGLLILLLIGFYIYLLYSKKDFRPDPLAAMALAIPIALLATYNWAYDQIMLVVTIIFCVQSLIGTHK